MRKVTTIITLLPAFLFVLLSYLFFAGITQSHAATGSIRICKAIADQNGNVIDGSSIPGATFTIAGFTPNPVTSQGAPVGTLPSTTFTTPLTLNAKIFSDSTGNDSQCVEYNNIQQGGYYYSEESASAGWSQSVYNDQFSTPVSKVTDVFPYDGSLFDTDLSNDTTRNENADGHIVLDDGRFDRTLVVVNSLIANPTATPTPNTTNTNNGGGSSSNNGGSNSNPAAPVCNDTMPSSAPAITSVSFGNNTVTLTWSKAADPVSYYLVAYGTQPGVYTFGNPNAGNADTTNYIIQGLSGGTTYYFAVRAVNGCKPGPFSNEVSSTPNGGFIAGPATGFTPDVLGSANTPAITSGTRGITTQVISICTQCLWWPILLGEAVFLALYYVLVVRRTKKKKELISRFLIPVATYIIFLLLNSACFAPLWWKFWTWHIAFASWPCKYFWLLDALVFIGAAVIRETYVAYRSTRVVAHSGKTKITKRK